MQIFTNERPQNFTLYYFCKLYIAKMPPFRATSPNKARTPTTAAPLLDGMGGTEPPHHPEAVGPSPARWAQNPRTIRRPPHTHTQPRTDPKTREAGKYTAAAGKAPQTA